MSTLSQTLTAYRLYARAEGKSPRTVEWITSCVQHFIEFLGGDQELVAVSAEDLRRFIRALQDAHKYRKHPYSKPQPDRLSPQSTETYARAIRAFFGHLFKEEFIGVNPMQNVRMPRVPQKVVPTFSERDLMKLISQPDKHTDVGFRDYNLFLTFGDTAARVSEVVNLTVDDVDFENGYLKVLGKGGRERYIPFGQKLAKVLLKYKMKYRPEPVATDRFFLTAGGRPMSPGRIGKIFHEYGRKAGLKRCYPHKLRHTSSVMFLRNGGDPFSLQKKLGHSSLQMTRHYSNLADSDDRAAQLKYSPVDRMDI